LPPGGTFSPALGKEAKPGQSSRAGQKFGFPLQLSQRRNNLPYDGYKVRLCLVCKKETFHFRFTGDGCVAWVCRNCELVQNAKQELQHELASQTVQKN
jgi:hypothetical protein